MTPKTGSTTPAPAVLVGGLVDTEEVTTIVGAVSVMTGSDDATGRVMVDISAEGVELRELLLSTLLLLLTIIILLTPLLLMLVVPLLMLVLLMVLTLLDMATLVVLSGTGTAGTFEVGTSKVAPHSHEPGGAL